MRLFLTLLIFQRVKYERGSYLLLGVTDSRREIARQGINAEWSNEGRVDSVPLTGTATILVFVHK